MPKSQFIDPNEVRKSGWIKFYDIPVNQYNKTLEEERQNFSDEDLLRIYRDMLIIREFETMLSLIKTRGEYNGIKYDYPGPAHLQLVKKRQQLVKRLFWTRTTLYLGLIEAMAR